MKAKIKLITKAWTGWVPEQPKSQEKTFELEPGQFLELNSPISEEKILLKSINQNNVIIQTIKLCPRKNKEQKNISDPREENLKSLGINPITLNNHNNTNKGDGIDLVGNYDNLETILTIGETARFTTQTMDAGNTYEITLLEIKN